MIGKLIQFLTLVRFRFKHLSLAREIQFKKKKEDDGLDFHEASTPFFSFRLTRHEMVSFGKALQAVLDRYGESTCGVGINVGEAFETSEGLGLLEKVIAGASQEYVIVQLNFRLLETENWVKADIYIVFFRGAFPSENASAWEWHRYRQHPYLSFLKTAGTDKYEIQRIMWELVAEMKRYGFRFGENSLVDIIQFAVGAYPVIAHSIASAIWLGSKGYLSLPESWSAYFTSLIEFSALAWSINLFAGCYIVAIAGFILLFGWTNTRPSQFIHNPGDAEIYEKAMYWYRFRERMAWFAAVPICLGATLLHIILLPLLL